MLLEIFLAIALGIFFGIFTGLFPGIHINLVAAFLVSISAMILQHFSVLSVALFITAMAVTHTFLDIIPSTFLGAPEPDTVMAVLPGHQMLMDGKGHEAIMLSMIGSFAGLLLSILLFLPLLWIIPKVYVVLEPYIGWLLVIAILYLIYIEATIPQKLWSIFIFLISGMLGVIVLSSHMVKEPLFSMLSGLFGLSALLLSLKDNTRIPKQMVSEKITLEKKECVESFTAGTLSGTCASFFPGLGPSQAAVISSIFIKSKSGKSWLLLVGCIGVVNFVVSFVTLYMLQKARNGAVVAIQEFIPELGLNVLLMMIATSLLTGGFAVILAMHLSKYFIKIMEKVNYRKLCICIIIFLVAMTLFLASFTGLLILFVSTAIGILPACVNVKRSHAMGCLIVPVTIYFLF